MKWKYDHEWWIHKNLEQAVVSYLNERIHLVWRNQGKPWTNSFDVARNQAETQTEYLPNTNIEGCRYMNLFSGEVGSGWRFVSAHALQERYGPGVRHRATAPGCPVSLCRVVKCRTVYLRSAGKNITDSHIAFTITNSHIPWLFSLRY